MLVICHINIKLTEAVVMHEAGYVDYLEHLVPLPNLDIHVIHLSIWIITSCPICIIWEVLLAIAR